MGPWLRLGPTWLLCINTHELLIMFDFYSHLIRVSTVFKWWVTRDLSESSCGMEDFKVDSVVESESWSECGLKFCFLEKRSSVSQHLVTLQVKGESVFVVFEEQIRFWEEVVMKAESACSFLCMHESINTSLLFNWQGFLKLVYFKQQYFHLLWKTHLIALLQKKNLAAFCQN